MLPEWTAEFGRQCWQVLLESSVFILVGFLIASVLHVWMSRTRAGDLLRGLQARSVFAATLFGAPLPLCSCSVLPAAVALRRQGAGKGSVLSFLISTPETSVQSVLLTYALLGPFMALARPLAACVTALSAGLIENFAEKRWPAGPAPREAPTEGAGGSTLPILPAAPPRAGFADGLRHAFVDIFDDIVGWMLLSVLVAAAIGVLLPDVIFSRLLGNHWVAMLVMLAIGVPLYVCAEASTPIAAAFILQGVSPGAALVFLLVGPATNFGSIAVLAQQLGRRTVVIYLACICIVALAMGAALDLLAMRYGFVAPSRAMAEPFVPGAVKTAGAVVFLVLSVLSFGRLRYPRRLLDLANRVLPFELSARAARRVLAAAVVAAYGLSGFAIVGPDEVGLVKRFGRFASAEATPGLHYVGPWPVGRLEAVKVDAVRRVSFGRALAAGGTATIDERSGWMWLGDENVAAIEYAVHWSVQPGAARTFATAASDPERLIRVAAQSACREVLSTRTIDTIYTVARGEVEREVTQRLRAHCERAGSGIRIDGVRLTDMHAPSEVHEAFRDVASALEDRATRIDRAQGERARLIPAARGAAASQRADARADALRLLSAARAEAAAFAGLQVAAAAWPQVTRTRLYFEAMDRLLPTVRKYFRAAEGHGRAMELWLRARPMEESPPRP